MICSRHLRREVAEKRASELLLEALRQSRSKYHSSGFGYAEYKVEKGFLHWKVVT